MGATRFLATAVRCSAAVAVLFAGSTATLGQGRAAVRFDSARTALDACISASAAVENARSLLKAKNPTYHPFIDSAQTCVSDAQAAAAQPEWPTELRRRHRYVDRSLAAAATWLSRSENPRIEARFIRVARNVLAARRSLSRAALLLDAVATPALNDDPVTPPPPIPTPSDFMWTELVPSADSRVVYVSSSAGSDSNDGLSPEHPIKTLYHADALMRDGYPDWTLLKCGDTFTGTDIDPHDSPALIGNTGSGRSRTERMVYSTYGTGARPKIINGIFAIRSPKFPSNYRAVVGLEFTSTARADGNPLTQSGMILNSGGTDLLVEDCYVHGFNQGVGIDVDTNHEPYCSWYDVKFRRCIIADNYAVGGGSQGIICAAVHGLLFEGCVFDRNGWSPNVAGAEATMFNQNVYLQGNHPEALLGMCTDVVYRGNISARASCTGAQLRNGGVCENSLFLQNPSGLAMGANREAGANGGLVRNNVFLDGRDIANSGGTLPRGHAIDFDMLDGVEVCGNIIANQVSGAQPVAISIDTSMKAVSIHDNIVYNWTSSTGGGICLQSSAHATGDVQVYANEFQQPLATGGFFILYCWPSEIANYNNHDNKYYSIGTGQSFMFAPTGYDFSGWSQLMGESGSSVSQSTYPAPDQTIGSYNALLGGPATLEAFLAEVRKQSRANWRAAYSAEAVNNYIRTGFGRAAE